ncbi:Cysteine-rich secretory protein family protein [Paracoccus sediminis]|uniref:Cysteine-rich secretory protein family protein n=2 Tax=Paracoccus sediminis TaxID=1214787 RepID=A0A238W274_9RHOB|nr:Cysteine-rich secretory protein family protein [Paracoccus sediminis]
MMSLTRFSGVALCCGILAGCAQPPAGVSAKADPYAVQVSGPGDATCMTTSTGQNRDAANATNAVRSGAGLPPVRPDPVLARVAAQHACDMAKRGRMTHKGSATAGPGPRVKAAGYAPMVTAENIAAGPFSQERVLAEWDASEGHRANMLIPQVRDYGIGQAIGPDGRTRFWAAVYAAPK